MLLVRTRLGISSIEGIGLFAAERIAAGTRVWEFSPAVDHILTHADLGHLSPASREQVEKYAYLDRVTHELILCGDDARFFNHSLEPNVVDEHPYRCVAARDISAGDELLCNYYEFDALAPAKLRRA